MVLTSGTVIAQAISYAFTPLVTRLFTTDDFGAFGVFMRIVAFLAAIGTARYELTLPLPKRDQHAFQLFMLSLKIALYTLIISLLVGLLYWSIWENNAITLVYVIAIGSTAFLFIFKNIGINWAIRLQSYNRISMVNITTAAGTGLVKIIAGFLGLGALGLVYGTFVGTFLGVIWFFLDFVKQKKKVEYKRSIKKIKALSKEYREFPLINLPHTLIDTARELLIAFFLTYYLSTSLFGSYDLSFKMLKIPLLLIGTSIGQVMFQKASQRFANNQTIFPLVSKTVVLLFVISLLPFSVIYIWGGPIFAFVFGEEWHYAGQIASAISPWLMMNLVASAISMIPSVIKALRWFFWVGLFTSLIQLALFGFYPMITEGLSIAPISFFTIVSWVMVIVYGVVIIWELVLVWEASR
jgi:O-antigen/teichoic acid export membrane protein